MSRVDQLIARHCPDGVETRPLGEFATLIRGHGLPRADFSSSGVGAIHYGQIYTRYGAWTTSTISFVSPETARSLVKVQPNDLIITNTSENVKDVGKAVAWLGADTIVTGGHATVIRHGQDPKYLSYWFQSESFFRQKRALATGTKVIDVSAKQLAGVRIPVPPMEVQREIVRILDQFTELEAELEAELVARRQQYEFYKNRLLSFENYSSVKWLPMGEVGSFLRGRRFTKADYVAGGIPCIHYGEIYTNFGATANSVRSFVDPAIRSRLRFAKPGDVVIAAVGETVEDVGKAVAWLGAGNVAIHDDCYSFSHDLNSTYVSYCMQTRRFHADKARHVARAKVKRLSIDGLARLMIPVPPMAEQNRIVEALSKFDALINDLSFGLPAELKARRRQYEYYRDRLLTFPEAAA